MADTFKVLIAIDNSEHAHFAFQYYMKHVHKAENEVVLLHVAELPGNSIMYMSGAVWEETIQREKDKTMALEKEYTEKLDKHQLSAKILASFGNRPGETICKTADDEGAYMIILGSRGSGKLRRTVMGSVSDYVMHHAHCPVVVCRNEPHHHHRTSLLDRIRRRSGRTNSESERERKNSESEQKASGSVRQSKTSEGSEKARHASGGSDRQRNISGKSFDSGGSGAADVFEDKDGH